MLTYQDFEKASDRGKFITKLIGEHRKSEAVQTAREADQYDRQKNVTINQYVRQLFTLTGMPVDDFTAANNKIASNFFNRLNTQRCTYLLGNGVTFSEQTREKTRAALGTGFDTALKRAGYLSLIHGVTFCFWNVNRMHVFPLTEFAPLYDEENGRLRAGIRYWQVDDDKPVFAVLYEEDGFTKYRSKSAEANCFDEVEKKRAYRLKKQSVPAEAGEVVVGEQNYGALPIVPLWGSRLKQSTLVGLKQSIDSYDLIRSGFANDLSDCAQIYWILENYGGMSDEDLARFRDRLKLHHIAAADTSEGGKIQGYTQEIPYEARKAYLEHIRAGMYEDFGGLDVHTIAAGATNDHIDAAYQPMDEQADDFEYQVIECVQQILRLQGIEDTPVFKRNRISNQKEQVEMLALEADWLDDETILSKLPNISPDEIETILRRRGSQEQSRFARDANNDRKEQTGDGDA